MNSKATCYISAMAGLAAISAVTSAATWRSHDPGLFAICGVLAVFATLWKVQIPKVTGNVSAGFVFLLIGVGQFSAQETVLIALVSGLAQSLFRKRTPPKLIQVVFNTSALMVSAAATYGLSNALLPGDSPLTALGRLVFAGIALFLLNSLALAMLFGLMGQIRMRDVWKQIQIWVAPYYVTGGVIAAAVVEANILSEAWSGLSLLPVLVLAYQYYKSVVISLDQPAHQ